MFRFTISFIRRSSGFVPGRMSLLSIVCWYWALTNSSGLILSRRSEWRNSALSFVFCAQGKPSLPRISGSRYQGYPPKISSAHSPESATFTCLRICLQNASKEKSTSAMPGRSLASVASSNTSSRFSGVRTVHWWSDPRYFCIIAM